MSVFIHRGKTPSRLAFFGLFALQHRGQESAGIAAANGQSVNVHVDMGLVTQTFRERDFYPLTGEMAIGHTRYSTMGSSQLCNAQPIVLQSHWGQLALANNGNIINSPQLKTQLQSDWNCVFNSTTDSEILGLLLAAFFGWDLDGAIVFLHAPGGRGIFDGGLDQGHP